MKRSNTFIIIVLTVFVCLILIGIRHYRAQKISAKQYSELELKVIKTIKSEFRLDGSKPFILYPHKLDSLGNYHLTSTEVDSLESHIAKVLLKSYMNFNDSILRAKDFVPFIKYPQKTDNLGNYQLSKEDLESIKKYIQFLSDKVDTAVEDSKANISNDIERLNTWVSIWLGILGFIGIFVPIGINLFTTKDIIQKVDYAEKQSSDAIKAANEIRTLSTNASKELTKIKEESNAISENLTENTNTLLETNETIKTLTKQIEGIEKRSYDSDNKLEESVQLAKDSNDKALEAIEKSNKIESILYQINSMAKIKRLDFQRISLMKSKDVGNFLGNSFKSIQVSFRRCRENKLAPNVYELFKETLEEFYLSFYQITRFIDSRKALQLLEQIKEIIMQMIAKGEFDDKLYEELDQLFNQIINEFNKKTED